MKKKNGFMSLMAVANCYSERNNWNEHYDEFQKTTTKVLENGLNTPDKVECYRAYLVSNNACLGGTGINQSFSSLDEYLAVKTEQLKKEEGPVFLDEIDSRTRKKAA